MTDYTWPCWGKELFSVPFWCYVYFSVAFNSSANWTVNATEEPFDHREEKKRFESARAHGFVCQQLLSLIITHACGFWHLLSIWKNKSRPWNEEAIVAQRKRSSLQLLLMGCLRSLAWTHCYACRPFCTSSTLMGYTKPKNGVMKKQSLIFI